MRYLRFVINCSVVLVLIAASTFAQQKKPSFEDMLSLPSIGSPVISPDGTKVIYTVRTANWDKNRYDTQVWLVDVKTGRSRQITQNEHSSSNIGWSPDGAYISFVSSRDDKSQVYILPLAGGESMAVTRNTTGINSYEWSPDSRWIAFTAMEDKKEALEERREKFGSYQYFEEEYSVANLWLCEVNTGESRTLVERSDLHVTSFDWSPDGSKIAFAANPDSFVKSFSRSDLYVVEVETGEVTPLVTQKGPDSNPVWSPDGSSIAFSTSMGVETYFVNSRIAVIPAEGGVTKVLTEGFDENPSLIDWKNKLMYFAALQGMQRHYFTIDTGTGEIKKLSAGEGLVHGSVNLSDNGEFIAFTRSDADNYTEVFYSRADDFSPVKLTDYNEKIADWSLSIKETIAWKSLDGEEITGVLIKPVDFDPGKKYPLFVIIHGGPTGISIPYKIDRYNRYYPIEQWVAKGALVLEPNYRGSAGFGERFRSINYRNLGVGDYEDVISGVDHLIDLGYVDGSKVAAMGWSQGGYISAFITTFSDRFIATSVGAGISDWVDYYYRTDITPFCIHYLGDTPWADPQVYAKTSPMTHINKARTPTLIQHGENDARVPINNAHKLYRGLVDNGVLVRFIIYKGFGHGISKPKENLAVLTHNWHWFNEHVWGEKPAGDFLEDLPESGEETEDSSQ